MPPPRAKGKERKELKIEISFLEGLRKRDEKWIDVHRILADDYTELGDYEAALAADLEVTSNEPENAGAHYNLACSFSLTNCQEPAGEALLMAAALGYEKIRECFKDPHLEKLRASSEWPYVLKGLRQLQIRIPRQAS